MQESTQVIDNQRWKVEVTVLAVLLTVLCTEFVIVHTLIDHALASGNAALDTLRALTQKST